jgi:CubicO group peptidase (beta-lactamase class C family)
MYDERRGRARGWFVCLASLLIPGFLCAGDRPPLEPRIRAILEQRIAAEKAMGIVVGVLDERGTTVVGAGRRSKDDGRAPDGDTVFEIGSITKVFTTTLLADMVERGEVSLDDRIAELLPESVRPPANGGEQITLLHLATQTSGLPRLPANLAPADPTNPYADYGVDALHAFLSSYTLPRAPGALAEYSNVGMGLLGHLLARKAGKSYEALVRERIAEPLGMKSTAVTLTPELRERLAPGHDLALEATSSWDLPTLAGAGALRSTVNDMLAFARANLHATDSTLSKAMQNAQRPRRDFGRPGLEIGMGWIVDRSGDSEIVWHNGGTGGYHSFLGLDEKGDRAVVVLSNSAHDIDDIGMHLLDPKRPLAEIAPARRVVAVDPSIYDEYVGDYVLVPTFVMAVTREGDRIFVQATGQPKIEIFPESATKFFAKVVDAQISFVKDETGGVDHLILHQGGRDQKATKRAAEAPPSD